MDLDGSGPWTLADFVEFYGGTPAEGLGRDRLRNRILLICRNSAWTYLYYLLMFGVHAQVSWFFGLLVVWEVYWFWWF